MDDPYIDNTTERSMDEQARKALELARYSCNALNDTEALAAIDAALSAPAAPVAQGSSWLIAADLAENNAAIREALEAFAADQTEDNAAGIVAAVLDTAPQCAAHAAPVAQPLTDELLNAAKSAITCSYESHGRRSVNAQAWDRLMQAVAAVSHGIGQGGA